MPQPKIERRNLKRLISSPPHRRNARREAGVLRRLLQLRPQRLWPETDASVLRREADSFCNGEGAPTIGAVFIAGDDPPIGFLELSVRPYANGCDSMPVPFVEGWYVEPEARGRGAGHALMLAAEAWARERGYREIGSDAQLANAASQRAHEGCGFVETERIVYFRKSLERAPSRARLP